jgi:hypothetical protein
MFSLFSFSWLDISCSSNFLCTSQMSVTLTALYLIHVELQTTGGGSSTSILLMRNCGLEEGITIFGAT